MMGQLIVINIGVNLDFGTGSAFGDVDGPFGSLGSFWEFEPRKGAFEVNPPFAPAPLLRAAFKSVQIIFELTGELMSEFIVFVSMSSIRNGIK